MSETSPGRSMTDKIKFHDYTHIIVNSSGGKDSLAALYEIWRIAREQDYPFNQIKVSHQDLGRVEWEGTKSLVQRQADLFGFDVIYTKRRNMAGDEPDLLDYVERRGSWPSSSARYCTSDFKRGPGARVVTALTKGMEKSSVLYVFGFRAEESPARSKKQVFVTNKRLTTKTRTVHDWLPIHEWTEAQVWSCIKGNGLPYHKAYDLGMPRLSCVFCIFAPKDALVIAGRHNRDLLDTYVDVEEKIGHTFRKELSLAQVRDLVDSEYQPTGSVASWAM